MSTNEAAQAWNGLMEFLAYDEDLTDDGVLRDLRDSGVDTDSFLTRIGDTVRRGIQTQRRKKVETERKEAETRLSRVRQRVGRFPIERVRQIAREAEQGRFGAVGQELAIACRNKQEVEPTEEELRALAEDILMTSEEDDGNHEDNTQG